MSKEILFNKEARDKLKAGVDIVANAVKVTLGPKGRNVIISDGYGVPHVTKDGVTVARSIELKDPFENMGAQLIREVAMKTGDNVGDGTTTSTILAQSMIELGIEAINNGANPIDIKRGIDKAVLNVVESLNNQAELIDGDSERIEQIATISANNDEEIGKLIGEIVKKVGKDGTVTIEESKGLNTTISIVEGMKINRGFLSPHFINNRDNNTVVFEDPYILLLDGKITSLERFMPILQAVLSTNKPLLIIADDITEEPLNALIQNATRGKLKVAVIKSPGFADGKFNSMLDIATITGGTVIKNDFKSIELNELGKSNRINVDRDSTLIVGGMGSKDSIKEYTDTIKKQIESSTVDYEIKRLKERLAIITGGVAVIRVGAGSEVEIKEKIDRIDDALCATRAALEEGILPGGGMGYYKAWWETDPNGHISRDDKGFDIVRMSLLIPMRCISENAGNDFKEVLINLDSKNSIGYNAKTNTYEDLKLAGVIDPKKVARIALENAASIAGMFLLTECLVCEV